MNIFIYGVRQNLMMSGMTMVRICDDDIYDDDVGGDDNDDDVENVCGEKSE